MYTTEIKERYIHMLPGRIRLAVSGLLHNQGVAELLRNRFAALNGVISVQPCTTSGRLLVTYDANVTGPRAIFGIVQAVEQQWLTQQADSAGPNPPDHPLSACEKPPRDEINREVAATMETDALPVGAEGYSPFSPGTETDGEPLAEDGLPVEESIRYMPRLSSAKPSAQEKVPLPLALSMGGLAVLGIKQVWMGPSALARSPAPFYLSALVAAVTGYPMLKRGLQQFSQKRKWNADLLLGTSALALAFVRENLLVLAGISILQYVEWKRKQAALSAKSQVTLSPDIQRYSNAAGRWGMVAAGATLAVTRQPLRALAVLLAANPRVATLPAETAWHQADLVSRDRNYRLPKNGSLSQLALTKTVLIEDSSLLFDRRDGAVHCVTNEAEPDKLICLAASLLRKSSHPWREDVLQIASQTNRTMRTAFHVIEEETGIEGQINHSRYFIGELTYIQQRGTDPAPYLLDAKRLQKQGHHVLWLAKEGENSTTCLGLLVRPQDISVKNSDILAMLGQRGCRIGLLHDSLCIGAGKLEACGLTTSWLLEPGNVLERIASMRQQGEQVLLVTGDEPSTLPRELQSVEIPSIGIGDLPRLIETFAYADQVNQTVHRHLRAAKGWNAAGSVLATLGLLTAPVTNLIADALSLVFLARTTKIGKQQSAAMEPPHLGRLEVAAAAAPALSRPAIPWHAVPWEKITAHYQVDPDRGLSAEHATVLSELFGRNQLAAKQPAPWLVTYLRQFKEFSTMLLLATSVLAVAFTGGWIDGIAMGLIILANAAISTIQERKAEAAVIAINQYQVPMCRVLREGRQVELSASALVPGDIVCLEAGDRVPADLRLIQAWNLQVDEAALTGESLPVEKDPTLANEECPLPERKNMLYMGTDVCRGKGIGIVVHTGMDTAIGQLSSVLQAQGVESTPLQERVTAVSKTFVKGALAAAAAVFLTGLLRGIPVSQMIATSITLAASAIPEGLPVTITIGLTAGIFRMAKKNTLVRKMSAVETLGRTTVVCTDKTGTLTKNEMTVKEVTTVGRSWQVTGNGYDPVGAFMETIPEAAAAAADADTAADVQPAAADPELARLLQICVLCNNSKLELENGQWNIIGDPTEGALLTLAAKAGIWQQDLNHWQRGAEVPFDSRSGKMSVVCRDTSSGEECFLFSKGAVEAILRHCSHYQAAEQVLPLTDAAKQQILLQNQRMSEKALRVLAFAYRPVDPKAASQEPCAEQELIFVGLAGMIDPPKAEVEKSIREAHALGIKPVMITGDHPITAIAIAKQLGIYDGTQKVLSGHELDRLSDEELEAVVDDVTVFARVAPEQKLRIVQAFQRHGHTVAMTGDGVNDSLAIKQADVGIAMGQTGTEVTKQTAGMVLKEDHFGSIVDGVKDGRTIISNIRKAIGCLLTGNLAEIIVTSAAVIVGLPIPLIPIQVLLMNLITDALPATILAVNPGNKTKQTRRTDIVDRDLYRKVITRGVLLGAASLGLFASTLAFGASLATAQTVAFATLVAGQLIQTFSWRQEGTTETVRDWSSDRFLVGALTASWLTLAAAVYIPPVARFFHAVPLPLAYWIPILTLAGSVSFLSNLVLSAAEKKPVQDTPASPASPVCAAAG
ncbi:MAG: cation-translocating P-type ATPase [Brevibacillus sp.]|nr:cation-translocating P-type ATPase [Brevibacillus sp.]